MKVKKFLSTILASTLLMSTVACTQNDDSTSSSNEKDSNSITIWAWDEAFNIKAAQEAKDLYLKTNPNVEINIVTMAQDDIVAKLNTSLSSKSYQGLPNVVLIEDYKSQGYLTSYENEFEDLSDIINQDDFASYKTAVNQVNGKVYGVPFDSGVAATFYRVDLIEQAGYTKEDMQDLTWEKYIEIGKAVKEKTGKYLCTLDPNDIYEIRMMMQSAGTWYTNPQGKVWISDNQALKDAITIYKNLVDSGIIKQTSGWDQFVGAMNNGDVAAVVTGCWIAPSIKMAEDQSGKWAVAKCPRMASNKDSINAASVGGAGWYVLKNTGNTELAKDFLKNTFASSVELMNTLADKITLISTLESASNAPNYSKPDEFFSNQKLFSDLAEWQSNVPFVNFGLNTYAIEDLMTEAVQSIINGADIDKTLKEYQSQIEAAIGN